MRKTQVVVLFVALCSTLVFFQNCSELKPIGSIDLQSDSGRFGNDTDEPSEDSRPNLAPPVVNIESRPVALSNVVETEISFNIDSPDQTSNIAVECTINGQISSPCLSPIVLTELPEGDHTVEIRATDSEGQSDSEAVDWKIDLTPAMVSIAAGPNFLSLNRNSSVSFVVDDQMDTGIEKVECRINDGPLEDCVSPKTYDNLPDGTYRFRVIATDNAGNTGTADMDWLIGTSDNANAQGYTLLEPFGLEISNDDRYAYLVDQFQHSLVQIDLSSGNRIVVSDQRTGVGPQMDTPNDVALGPNNQFAYVVDAFTRLFRVNLVTGERVIVSGPDIGNGPPLTRPRSIVVNSLGTHAYVTATNLVLIQVDLANGNRVVAAQTRNYGGPISSPSQGLAINGDDTIAYSTDRNYSRKVLRIDLANGNGTAIGDLNIPPRETEGAGLDVGPAGAFVYTIDPANGSLYRIDANNGNVVTVSGPGVGAGPQMVEPIDVALNSAGTFAYVIDIEMDSLFRVDLANGNRTLLSDTRIGTGVAFEVPKSLAPNSNQTAAYLVSHIDSVVYRLDLATGNRSIVSGGGVGNGPNFNRGDRNAFTRGVGLNANGSEAFVMGYDRGEGPVQTLMRVNLANGNRSIVSRSLQAPAPEPEVGTGPVMLFPMSVVIDSSSTFAYVTDFSRDLLRINIATGQREDLFQIGSGPTEVGGGHFDVAFNLAQNRLYVSTSDAVYRVSLPGGARTIVSGLGVGGGPAFGANVFDYVEAVDVTNNESTIYAMESLSVSRGGVLYRINAANGNRTIVSSEAVGSGPNFRGPGDMFLNVAETHAYVVDEVLDAVFRVDLSNGNRVIISK